MNKGVLFFVFAMIIAVGAFAQEENEAIQELKKRRYEIGVGYHSITETQKASGVEFKTTMPSFAINFAGANFFTEKFGFASYVNFLFPQEMTLSAQGQSVTVDKDDFDFLFALDILIGPAFMLHRTKNFYLPLTVGFHYLMMFQDLYKISSITTEIGLGANITGEYHFNPNIYVYGRLQFSLDLYAWGTVSSGYASAKTSGDLSTFGIEPCIGLGFQW
ncbi:MAG: hypothetical protein Ta2B_14590 [Termitinemataceae bacterium]|nr:MAG: hypothetical protein Ta2B_14590 [Termitinemataceae bacterium]